MSDTKITARGVKFINILGQYHAPATLPVAEITKEAALKDKLTCVLCNPTTWTETVLPKTWYSYGAIYKQDIDYAGNPITNLSPVATESTENIISDFNIQNHHGYKYIYYPFASSEDFKKVTSFAEFTEASGGTYGDDETTFKDLFSNAIKSTTASGKKYSLNIKQLKQTSKTIYVDWERWSITELHPVDNSMQKFSASIDDVWLFNCNLSTGEQNQNIILNAQQNLSRFDKYSISNKNYISGSVTCLLGREVYPASWVTRSDDKSVDTGGYQERLYIDTHPTSNKSVDMLLKWKKLVHSNNPKLLKDRQGNSYIVMITQSSNQVMDNVGKQPNTINFSWNQIGTTDNITIVNPQKAQWIETTDSSADASSSGGGGGETPSTPTKTAMNKIIYTNDKDEDTVVVDGDDINQIKDKKSDSQYTNANIDIQYISYAEFANSIYLTNVLIDSVTKIDAHAFDSCQNLQSIIIKDGVISIGYRAFYNCTNLQTITIPDSITSIFNEAFDKCTSLQYNEYDKGLYLGNEQNPYVILMKAKSTSITSCVINKNCKIIYDYAFYGCSNLTSITIPDSVTSIGPYAFHLCMDLTSVTIGNNVTSILSNAFSACYKLTSVIIPDSVTSIEERTFAGSGLTSITIPDSVTIIKASAFSYCSDLTTVTIGNSVTSIKYHVFEGCTDLQTITIYATTPPSLGVDAIPANILHIYVPATAVDDYKNTSGWDVYSSKISAIITEG